MKAKKSKIWVLTASSESGDDYGPWLFDFKPTDRELEMFLREEAPGEWEDEGPGFKGSYLFPKLDLLGAVFSR